MKIAFIFPPFGHKKFSENLKVVDEEFTLSPPIILAYVAAIAEKAGHDVILIDAHALKLTKEEVLLKVKRFGADLLAFRVETYNFHDTLSWIQYLKLNTSLPILVGGINMDLYPIETMEHKEIDFGLAGEAIYTLPKFLSCLENNDDFKNVSGLYWRDESTGEIRFTPAIKQTVSFDEYPFPARHLLPNEVYHSFVSQRKNFTIMLTQTGCPYRCKFCAIAAIKNYRLPAYRRRSWENVIREIEQCYYDFGIREIDIFDATFFIDKQRDIKICEEIIKRGIKISWTCRSRVDLADEEVLKIASKAGLRMIFWGIESGNIKVLENVHKDIKLEQTINAIKLAKKYGIKNLGFLMIGNPGDTEETIKQTVKFAKYLDLDYVQICRTIAKPSTELHKELMKLTGQDYWSDWILGKVSEQRIPTPWSEIPQKKIETLLKWAYYSFYFRPVYILKRLMDAKSLEEVVRYVKVGLRMVFHYFYTDIPIFAKSRLIKKLAHVSLENKKFMRYFTNKNVCIVLPCYNESNNILVLIKKVFALYPTVKIVVVDSSDDSTSKMLINFAKIYPNRLSVLRVNKETSGNERAKAVKEGFKYAVKNGAEIIIEMDSDLSHRPEDIKQLLTWIDDYDIVVGSRFKGGKEIGRSVVRRILTYLANIYIRYMLGVKDICDFTSGFRCYKKEALEKIGIEYLKAIEGTAGLIEILYKAVKLGLKVKEVPIVYIERVFGSSKFSIKTFVESIKIVKILSRSC